MSNLTIGDLANTFQLRRFTGESKANLTRLAKELTTGEKSDLGAATGGDFGPLGGIERSLRALAAYKTSNNEAATMFESAQLSLESVQDLVSNVAPALLTAASSKNATLVQTTAVDAAQKFDSIVSRLNTKVADRNLFSGAASDKVSLASAKTMLDDIKLATAGLTTAADIETAVVAWFDDVGGGFETIGYLGSLNDMGPMIVADGETVEMNVRADSQTVRDTLKGFAMAALVADGALTGNLDEQTDLIGRAANRVVASDSDITTLRARIGTSEEKVELAQARNAAETAAYELSRNDLVSADPYETATMLETVYAQIETLYTITARISALRFTDYMR